MTRSRKKSIRGYTLVEISLVLGLTLILSAMGIASAGIYTRVSDARKAEAVLREVESARTAWLLDNPQSSYEDVTLTELTPYLPTPDSLTKLRGLGYALGDGDLKQEAIKYTRLNKDVLAIPNFPQTTTGK